MSLFVVVVVDGREREREIDIIHPRVSLPLDGTKEMGGRLGGDGEQHHHHHLLVHHVETGV